MDQSSRIAFLFNRYAAGVCTNAERDEYLEMVKNEIYAAELQQLIAGAVEQAAAGESLTSEEAGRMLQEILHPIEVPVIPISNARRTWRIIWMAASILLLIGVGIWFGLIRTPKADVATTDNKPVVTNDVAPGGNKAILTLSDNSTIILDSAANGTLAKQGKTTVIKSGEGQLVYDAKALTTDHSPLTYNTLSTPRGGQYQLVLPDGSKVWLNAASSIRYPTSFTGNERRVEITGEAYFEVKPLVRPAGGGQEKMPFVVKIVTSKGDGGEVRVLGTHFNINAYSDEQMVKTTLLEGKVKTSMVNGEWSILKPGEQAVIQHSQLTIDHSPDIEQTMAWKNGQLLFRHTDIATIMRQAARWYDVDIEYKDRIEETYTVSVPRNVPVSRLLQAVEMSSGVHFKIDGKKIIVSR